MVKHLVANDGIQLINRIHFVLTWLHNQRFTIRTPDFLDSSRIPEGKNRFDSIRYPLLQPFNELPCQSTGQ